jgi:hypothetical protein
MPWLLLALSAVRTGSLRQYGTPIFFIVSATWSSMQMTMKLVTLARRRPSIHILSMPDLPSAEISAKFETAATTSLLTAIFSCGGQGGGGKDGQHIGPGRAGAGPGEGEGEGDMPVPTQAATPVAARARAADAGERGVGCRTSTAFSSGSPVTSCCCIRCLPSAPSTSITDALAAPAASTTANNPAASSLPSRAMAAASERSDGA